MFLEPHFKGQRSGWIEVICGSMFSGKTEELIRRIKRVQYAYQKVVVFKPKKDVRYHEIDVVSHNQAKIPSIPIDDESEIYDIALMYDVIGIDESQFFSEKLVSICEGLAFIGKRVIVAGLDMDYRGQPFGPIPSLLAVAEYITKVHAICVHCGNLATHSFRLVDNDSLVFLGEKDVYEPRCRVCFQKDLLIDFNKSE